ARIEPRQRLANSEALAECRDRLLAPACPSERGTDSLMADREIALPLSIAGIGGDESLANESALVINRERFLLASQAKQTADIVIADRKVAVALEIGGLRRSERLSDRQAHPINPEPLLFLTCLGERRTEAIVADGEIALPMRIAGILAREL